MSPLLRSRYDASFSSAQGSHSTNINQDHLPTFLRVVEQEPEQVAGITGIYVGNMAAHASNNVASLYGLIKLAAVSDATRENVRSALPEGFIEEYKQDKNEEVASNAAVLEGVLNGDPIEKYQKKPDAPSSRGNIYIGTAHNVAINSPGAVQSLQITNTEGLDDETRQLIEQLKQALENKDSSTAKKIFGYIVDKSIDIAVKVALGHFFKT